MGTALRSFRAVFCAFITYMCPYRRFRTGICKFLWQGRNRKTATGRRENSFRPVFCPSKGEHICEKLRQFAAKRANPFAKSCGNLRQTFASRGPEREKERETETESEPELRRNRTANAPGGAMAGQRPKATARHGRAYDPVCRSMHKGRFCRLPPGEKFISLFLLFHRKNSCILRSTVLECNQSKGLYSSWIRVPVSPRMPSRAFSSRVMRAQRPGLERAKATAASTLGSMEPGANCPWAMYSSAWDGVS